MLYWSICSHFCKPTFSPSTATGLWGACSMHPVLQLPVAAIFVAGAEQAIVHHSSKRTMQPQLFFSRSVSDLLYENIHAKVNTIYTMESLWIAMESLTSVLWSIVACLWCCFNHQFQISVVHWACLRRSAAFNDLYKSLLDSILEALSLELLGLRMNCWWKSPGKPRDSRRNWVKTRSFPNRFRSFSGSKTLGNPWKLGSKDFKPRQDPARLSAVQNLSIFPVGTPEMGMEVWFSKCQLHHTTPVVLWVPKTIWGYRYPMVPHSKRNPRGNWSLVISPRSSPLLQRHFGVLCSMKSICSLAADSAGLLWFEITLMCNFTRDNDSLSTGFRDKVW